MRRALDEYAVGGIKTTLPLFREILRDQEFLDAKLDTGFIPRFNERHRTASGSERDKNPTLCRDMAIVAGALAYLEAQCTPAANHQEPQSKWRIAARVAGLGATTFRK